MSATSPFMIFTISSYSPSVLSGPPPFIELYGSCPGSTFNVVKVGDSLSATTMGQIVANATRLGIFAASTACQELRTCLNQMGTGTVQLKISYNAANMRVCDISCKNVPSALLSIEQKVLAIANTGAEINQRLERDLSGAVLDELRRLNQHVSEALDIFRAGMGMPRGGRSHPESDVNELGAPHQPGGDGERAWPDSSNGVEAEPTPDQERHAV